MAAAACPSKMMPPRAAIFALMLASVKRMTGTAVKSGGA
jgi:hypothetical protein